MTEQILKNVKRINVLMVEDNAMDAILTTETLSESERNSYEVSTVRDGVDALAFLHGVNGYENSPQPDLIILDLNLPRMHGFDFLMEIKKERNLSSTPVIILTTSEAVEDIERAKELGADSYIVKPLDLDRFEEVLSDIQKRRPIN